MYMCVARAEVVGDCSSRRKVFYSFVTHTMWCAAHTQLSRSLLQRQWAQDVVGLLNRQLARISVGAVALGASFGVEDHVAYRAGAAHRQPQLKAESRRFSGAELPTALQVQPSTPARGRLEEWASFTLTSVPFRSQDNLRPSHPLRGCCSNALERVTPIYNERELGHALPFPGSYT